MKLSNCPYCGKEMEIHETPMPDFMLDHTGEHADNEDCPVYSFCVDSSFRSFTVERLIKEWNTFCEKEYDEKHPEKIPGLGIKTYCPITKTICHGGVLFDGIGCSFEEDGNCLVRSAIHSIEKLGYAVNDDSFINVNADATVYGEINTYEQNP